jgi:fumarate reductase subunit C
MASGGATSTGPGDGKPRRYVRPMPALWWLKRPAYFKFMVREVTSAFIAGYALCLLVLMCGAGDANGFHTMFVSLQSPTSVALHLVVLAFALFHTITFFNLTPRAIVVHRGEEKLPEIAIKGAHYAGWVVVSAVLFFIVLRG